MKMDKILRPKSRHEILFDIDNLKNSFYKIIYSSYFGYISGLEDGLKSIHIKIIASEATEAAARGNNVNVLIYLKSKGVNIHMNNMSSLKTASSVGSYDAAKFLLEDCNYNIPEIDYLTAIELARIHDNPKIYSLLNENLNV